MSRSSRDGLDELVGILAVIFLFFVLAFLAALFAGGAWLVRYLLGGAENHRESPTPPIRLFGAPASTRWLTAYDYGLYKLENTTGIAFNTTPARLMAGALIITVGPAVMVGLPLFIVEPVYGGAGLLLLTIASAVVGLLTGWQLTRPAAGWFDFRRGGGSSDGEDGSGFTLGDD
jgi:hypothetical protein